MIKSRRGSFSILMALMIPAIVILMGVLLHAVTASSRKMTIQAALIQQQDLLMSFYSEITEDRYGIFATAAGCLHEDSFREMTKGIPGIREYRVTGIAEMEGKVLYDAITGFSRPRFPIEAAAEMINKMNGLGNLTDYLCQTASDAGAAGSTSGGEASKDGTDDAEPAESLDYETLVEMLNGLTPQSLASGNKPAGSEEIRSLDEIHALLCSYRASEPLECGFSDTIQSDLAISGDTLNRAASFFDNLYAIPSSELYDRLSFEFYVSRMFSCKVNFHADDSGQTERKDMRGRGFSIISPSSEPEMERILFGLQTDAANVAQARTSIRIIRFLCQLIANLTDQAKRQEIRSMAEEICALVALASGGSVVLTPEAAEAALLVIRSTSQADEDYRQLIAGNGVELLPVSGWEKVRTYYDDYLQWMLLAVPMDRKLERIRQIIVRNTCGEGGKLYTGQRVSCRYSGIRYFYENTYRN